MLEITDLLIKYKDFDFQDGPTRNINISDVFMITYENGQKEVFKQQTPAPTPAPAPAPAPIKQENRNLQQSNTGDPTMTIYRFRSMSDRQQDEYFARYFPGSNLSKTFHSGVKLKRAGVGLFIPGIILTAAGLGMAIGAEVDGISGYIGNYYWFDDEMYGLYCAGWSFFAIGQTLTIISIPLRAIGGGKKKHVQNEYINGYLKETSMSQSALNFGLTATGVGFTVKF